MAKKTIINKKNLVLLALLLVASAIIVLIMPRPGRQSYFYELNQPWKYPLLTAAFDTPILRDSMTIKALRDSIDRNFIPFVMRDEEISRNNISRLKISLHDTVPPAHEDVVIEALGNIYAQGIIETSLYDRIINNNLSSVRIASSDSTQNTVTIVATSTMMSPMKAFSHIDSIYHATFNSIDDEHNRIISRALNECIEANVKIDSLSDTKFRNQEYLNVSGAQGIIKQGQRIVDRGEIVTPQVYTNLRTYEEILSQEKGTNISLNSYFAFGQLLYVVTIFVLLYFYMAAYRSRIYSDIRKMAFLVTFITLFTLFAIILSETFSSGIYLVPFAAVPVIILIFFDSRTAIFSLFSTVLLCAMVATYQFQFIFVEVSVGFLATFSMRQLSSRSQLLRTAIIAFLGYVVTYTIFILITEGNLASYPWRIIGAFAINSVILSFAYILIFVIEKIFGFTSTVTLVELSDINNPLLRRLAATAPGTFQHSIQVSTLAAEAARAIDADIQLVRTGALYHDIGKMENPIFFTENQHGVNPHNGLNHETSARKIINHVADGLTIASKAKLPTVVKDFIAQHHGKGLAKYFYTTAVNDAGGVPVDPKPYTYPGPNPRSKETAILMMADAVEAASRSLKDYSHESISTLVDKIINGQLTDGLFNDSPISLHDIQIVKETFMNRLATIYHSRVAYPEIQHSANSKTAGH